MGGFMGSKILFIEDAKQQIISLWKALVNAGLVEGSPPSDFQQFNERFPDERIALATSFSDAINRINQIDCGREYAMIFIDRDLTFYEDIQKKELLDIPGENDYFTLEFFTAFGKYLGDYLYFRLIHAGVPKEKLCFLSANNPNDKLDKEFKATAFVLHRPNYLSKGKGEMEVSGSGDPMQSESEMKIILDEYNTSEFIKHLKTYDEAAVRFKYETIFENNKVHEIFARDDINQFISILSEFYNGKKRDLKSDSTLRKMIESLVGYLDSKDTRVRDYLNLNDAYSALPKRFYTARNYRDYKSKYPNQKVILENIEKFLASDKKLHPTVCEREAEYVMQYATASYLKELANFYKGNPSNTDPPLYIFSYMDNIYTITSEFSHHVINYKENQSLSDDGWEALLHGMCQILQWIVEKYPNSSTPQS